MRLPRTFLVLFLVAVGVAGCSTGRVAVTPLPDRPTKTEALALAERHVRANTTRSEYQMSDSRFDDRERAWIIYYKRVPPRLNETAFDHNWFAVVVRSSTEIHEITE